MPITVSTIYVTNADTTLLARLADSIDLQGVTPMPDDSPTGRDLLTHYHVFEAGKPLVLDVPEVVQSAHVRAIQHAGRDALAITVKGAGTLDELEHAEDALLAHIDTLYGDAFVAMHRFSGDADAPFCALVQSWVAPNGTRCDLLDTMMSRTP